MGMFNRNAVCRRTQQGWLITLLLIFCVLCKASAQQVMHWTVDGTEREAMVYIPAGAKTQSTPVIFAFHGHGGTAGNMFRSRGFEQLWPEAIVVCPQGLNTPGQLTDPQGELPGWQKWPGDMNDRDLHFFDAMLKTMRQDYEVDDKRIYATGHSNGGGFTYLLWAQRGDVFAAVAPSSAVAGRIADLLKPLPAMHLMGENDPLVKPEWQRAMCNKIIQVNNCSTGGQSFAAYATLYPSPTGTPVVLYVHPGGHVYPPEANPVVIQFFKSEVKHTSSGR
jgi:polyhydroxybutyrate depolymerase